MDDVTIHDAGGLSIKLTCNSAASSYGVPILRLTGHGEHLGDFGRADHVPELGETAGAWVMRWAQEPGRTSAEIEAARRFAGQ